MAEVLRGRAFVREFGMPLNGKTDAVDAGPFLEWLDEWRQSQARARVSNGFRPDTYCRQPASLETLAELAGVSDRALRRARTTGRVSRIVVDRLLIAAGGNTMLAHLYPEH